MDVYRCFKSLADVCGYSRSLADVVRYFILVDFGEFLRLIDFSRFPRFRFKVKAIYYKIFLFII